LAIAERLLMPGHILAGVLGVSLYPFFSGGATRLVGLRAALVTFVVGCVVAAGSILLAAEVVVPAFGASYEEAVPVAQVLLLALPFVYGSSVLLTHLYSLGRERAVLLATAGASVAGTVGVLIGQAAGGVKYAAAAAVGRQALFLLILLALALEPVSTARRAHPETVR
jgi:O-antigen/teichoic acid export membrane protein